jgi:hypothetical protein
MNSPDMTRLAAALAKLDDPDIIELLLEAYRPTPTPAPQAAPVQGELLGHIQDRNQRRIVPARRAGSPWTRAEREQLRRMLVEQKPLAEMATRLGRSERSVTSAVEKHFVEYAKIVRRQSTYRNPR